MLNHAQNQETRSNSTSSSFSKVDVDLKKKLADLTEQCREVTKGSADKANDSAAKQRAYLDQIKESLDKSEEFYKPKGDGFIIVERLLRKFRDHKWIRERQASRFGLLPLGSNVIITENKHGKMVAQLEGNAAEIEIAEVRKIVQERGHFGEYDENGDYGTSKANIYYLSEIAEKGDHSANVFDSYTRSYKPGLEAILTLFVELGTEEMIRDPRYKIHRMGKLIKACFMDIETETMTPEELAENLGFTSVRTYYKHRNEAIGFLGMMLFGIGPGDYGMSKIVTNKDGKYVFDDDLAARFKKRKRKGSTSKEQDAKMQEDEDGIIEVE